MSEWRSHDQRERLLLFSKSVLSSKSTWHSVLSHRSRPSPSLSSVDRRALAAWMTCSMMQERLATRVAALGMAAHVAVWAAAAVRLTLRQERTHCPSCEARDGERGAAKNT
eukprot:5889572-Prymnesium_polylepis.2